MIKKYVYDGPASGVTLKGGREVLLFRGRTVELPEDHPYVRSLVARKHLKPVPESHPEPQKES